jgi:hypothetical protein
VKTGEVNRKKAVIRFQDDGGLWYGLDNAAIIMPAVSGPVETSLFRISARLDGPVKLPALQFALDRIVARMPYFVVELRRGFFWHYLVEHRGRPEVEPDSLSPCQGFDMHRNGTLLFRVRARGSSIGAEFSHIISDGTGGMRFFKNLLVEYFRLLEPADRSLDFQSISADTDFLDLDAAPDPEETEDAYHRNYPGDYPFPPPEPSAFHLKSALLPKGSNRVTTGVIPLASILPKAKEYGASLTEFLTAIYLEALQTIWLATPGPKRSSISLEVPVNMRNFFVTKTNRNFSLFVHAMLDMRLGPWELPEIIAKVHHQLRHEIDVQGMKRHIQRNVRGGRAFFIRAIPLALKAPLMRTLYNHFGLNLISGVISNMGPVKMPESAARRIESFTLIAAPASVTKTNAALLSWKDKLYFTFGSLARSRELERLFFSRLQSLGVPVRVECNFEE